MVIGAQLYTVRDFCKTPDEYYQTLKRISDIGYTCIQVSSIWELGIEIIKKGADKYNLDIVLTHAPEERILNDTEKLIEEHKYLGAKYIGLGAMNSEYLKSKEGIQKFIKDFKPAAQKIRDDGLKFMYHNHNFEFEKYDYKLIIDYLSEGFTNDEMGFILDTYWIQAGGGDPAYWIEKFKNRIDTIHFKDMTVVDSNPRFAEILEGNLNWERIFEACEKSGVKWAFIEQDDCYGKDPIDCLNISYKNLNKFDYK